jgi:hypothetical protein
MPQGNSPPIMHYQVRVPPALSHAAQLSQDVARGDWEGGPCHWRSFLPDALRVLRVRLETHTGRLDRIVRWLPSETGAAAGHGVPSMRGSRPRAFDGPGGLFPVPQIEAAIFAGDLPV